MLSSIGDRDGGVVGAERQDANLLPPLPFCVPASQETFREPEHLVEPSITARWAWANNRRVMPDPKPMWPVNTLIGSKERVRVSTIFQNSRLVHLWSRPGPKSANLGRPEFVAALAGLL